METPRKRNKQPKAIEFDQVYQNGQAEFKHKMVEHPEGSGTWFILRCDAHNFHFGHKPIVSAIRHLSSKLHKGFAQGGSIAIRELGIRVMNCNAAKAQQNNVGFATALKNGYQVLRGTSPAGSRRYKPRPALRFQLEQSDGDSESDEPPPPKPQRSKMSFMPSCDEITNLVVGELYLGSWHPRGAPDKPDWYALVVLPTGDFKKLGISGSISETRLSKYVPVCYKTNDTRTIFTWADGFEDGGPRVTKRKFPVMYFDDDQTIPSKGDLPAPSPDYLDWLPISRLRTFCEYGPESVPARGYDAALSFYSRLRAAKSASPLRRDVSESSADQLAGAWSKRSG